MAKIIRVDEVPKDDDDVGRAVLTIVGSPLLIGATMKAIPRLWAWMGELIVQPWPDNAAETMMVFPIFAVVVAIFLGSTMLFVAAIFTIGGAAFAPIKTRNVQHFEREASDE